MLLDAVEDEMPFTSHNRAAHTGWLEPCSSDRVAGEGPLYAVCVEDAELVVVSGADFGGWSTRPPRSRSHACISGSLAGSHFRLCTVRPTLLLNGKAYDLGSIRVVPRLLCSRWFSLVV